MFWYKHGDFSDQPSQNWYISKQNSSFIYVEQLKTAYNSNIIHCYGTIIYLIVFFLFYAIIEYQIVML